MSSRLSKLVAFGFMLACPPSGTVGCDDCQDAVTCGFYGEWRLEFDGEPPYDPEITLEISGCTGHERVSATSPVLDCAVEEGAPVVDHRECTVSVFVWCNSYRDRDSGLSDVAGEYWYASLSFAKEGGTWHGAGPAENCREEDLCGKLTARATRAD